MMSIAKCPRCLQLVSLPDGVDVDAAVRCPLCRAEYPLRESLPPALIPVEAVAAPPESPPPEDGLSAGALAAGAAASEPPSEADGSVVAPADEGSVPVEAGAQPAGEEAEAPEAPGDAGQFPVAATDAGEAEKPAETAETDDGMFDFLHGGGGAPSGTEASTETAPQPTVDTSEPSFAGFGMSPPAGERVPTSVAARPRRKEKSVAKEMLGVVIGGVVGLSLGYYGLNYFMGADFDFLKIWLPGIAHTQKHWPGGTDGEETGQNGEEAPEVPQYPAPPSPDGALPRYASRYLDQNYQRLIVDGKIRPESTEPPVSVKIDGQEYLTGGEGEMIETIEAVPIGGGKLAEGLRLKREGEWWVEVGEVAPEPDPADVAKIDPPADLPEMEPEPDDEPLPPDFVGPKHRPAYTIPQLGQALKAAHTEFQAAAPREPLSDPLYDTLCRLAERLTFVEADPDAPGVFERQMAAANILEDLGVQPNRVAEIAGRALARLDDLDASDRGIVAAGTAGSEMVRDGLHGIMLAMPGAETAYNVLSDKPLGVEKGDTVLVAGVAVANPSENLIGYPGNRPVVIWAGLTVRLPRPLDVPDEPPMEPPAEEPPAEEPPAEEPPAEEPPAEEPPIEELPTEELPGEEAPPEEAPMDPMPDEEPPVDEPAVDEPPADEPAVEEPPSEEMPDVTDEPADEDGSDAEDEPAGETPGDEAPAGEEPDDEAPAEDTSDQEPPANDEPAEAAPEEEASDEAAPVEG